MRKVVLLFITLSSAISLQWRITQAEPIEQRRDAASNLHFSNGVMATEPGDKRLYVLLGSGFLRAFSFGEPKAFVDNWLSKHPSSVLIPVSRMVSTNTRNHEQMEIVYIWIEDGASSLNVDLVQAGMFGAGTMYDMVDNQKGLDELLKHDPKLADARAQIERERAAAPQDRTDRLVPEDDYRARLIRFDEAERYARSQKLGIWSDAMKKEREEEGVR